MNNAYFSTRLVLPVLAGLVAQVAQAQTRDVSGRVTAASTKEALPGVTIVVKGTTIGTSTGTAGEFTLQVPDNATLVVSYVGFAQQEVPVKAGTTNLTITLAEDTKALDEVVVVGYGVQRKSDLTGSVASADLELRNHYRAPYQA
jgi:hypothetical protein